MTAEMDHKVEPAELMEMSLIEPSEHEDSDSESESADLKTILERRIETLMQTASTASDTEEFDADICRPFPGRPRSPIAWGQVTSDLAKMRGCPDCGQAFRGVVQLRRHQLREHGGHLDHPSVDGYDSDELARPVSPPRVGSPVQTNAAANYMQCPQCQWMYKTSFGLRQHMYTVHGYDASIPTVMAQPGKPIVTTAWKLVNCPFCPSKYLSLSGVQRHVRLMHSDMIAEDVDAIEKSPAPATAKLLAQNQEGRHQCEHCSTVLPDRVKLGLHLDKIHRRAPDRPCLPCPKCPLNFVRQSGLARHLESHTADEEQAEQKPVIYIQCDLCPLRFLAAESRRHKLHVQAAHRSGLYYAELMARTPRQSHTCDLCDWSFPSVVRLQRHRKSHHRSEDLPVQYFQCEHCPLRFAAAQQHRLHVERKHPHPVAGCEEEGGAREVKYFQCDYCPLRFVSEAVFARHVKKHRKASCICECGKRYFRHARDKHLLKCTKQRRGDGGQTNLKSSLENGEKSTTSAADVDKDPVLESVCPLECEVAITESDDTAQVEAALSVVLVADDRSISTPRPSGRPPRSRQRGCSECGLAFPPTGNQLRLHLWNEHGIGVPMRSQRVVKMEEDAAAANAVLEKAQAQSMAAEEMEQEDKGELGSPNPDALLCDYCPSRYAGKSKMVYLRKHIAAKHPEHLAAFNLAHPPPPRPPSPPPLRATCPLCPSVFKSYPEVRDHLKSKHRISKRGHMCEFCGAAFARVHMKRAHTVKCRRNFQSTHPDILEDQSHDEDGSPVKVAKLDDRAAVESAEPDSMDRESSSSVSDEPERNRHASGAHGDNGSTHDAVENERLEESEDKSDSRVASCLPDPDPTALGAED